jgi:DNA helicase-2/ATP-dependent DNA helicase PcrA
MASWLDELNPAQREAVTFGEGPLLVIAGAGTGKTKTLASRVAYLIEQGVAPERILLLTFTRRAAGEMISRAGHLTGQKTAGKVWGGTFHSVANRLLRLYGRAIQLAPDFTVMDQGDAADFMNLIRNDLGVAKDNRRFPRKETLVSIYSRMVNAETKLKEVLETTFPWCQEWFEEIRTVFQSYTQRKREQNVFDYDDLLLYWNALCATPGTGETVADRFDHVLVDEYQDTNAVQARILQGMRKASRNIMVVGDDAQSIYSFRAATVRNILDFPRQFPGAQLVTLEQNYRSTEPILAASNEVMSGARERYTKNLWSKRFSEQKPTLITCVDEAEQSLAVARRIVTHLEEGIPLKRQAVLFRVGYHSDQLEVELARRNIPFHKYGGLKFIEAAHVKDLLAFLRILENPYDEVSWFRVLLLLDGVGPQSARRIVTGLEIRAESGERADSAGQPARTPLRRLLERPPSVPAAARKQFDALRETVRECLGAGLIALKAATQSLAPVSDDADDSPAAAAARSGTSAEPPLVAQIERIRRFYDPIFKNRYDNAAMRSRDLEQLEQIAGGYQSRSRFITDLTLDPPSSTSDLASRPCSRKTT